MADRNFLPFKKMNTIDLENLKEFLFFERII